MRAAWGELSPGLLCSFSWAGAAFSTPGHHPPPLPPIQGCQVRWTIGEAP